MLQVQRPTLVGMNLIRTQSGRALVVAEHTLTNPVKARVGQVYETEYNMLLFQGDIYSHYLSYTTTSGDREFTVSL